MYLYISISYSILQILESPTETAKDVPNVAIKIKILEHAGPVVNLRTLRNKYNSSSRPEKDVIEDAIAVLQDEGLGDFVKTDNLCGFIKQVPTEVQAENLAQYKLSVEEYTSMFCRRNYDLPNHLKGSLLSKSILEQKINNYFDEEKENLS